MGLFTQTHKQLQDAVEQSEYRGLARVILVSLAITGMVSVAVLAPNTFRAIEALGMRKKMYSLPYLRAALRQLIQSGDVSEIVKDGKTFIAISAKGKQKLARATTKRKTIPRSKRRKDR